MTAAEVPDAEQRRAPTILVVEDEALLRLTTAEELRDHGFEVREAADGTQAVQILETEPVDLVFTDVNMPGEPDGLGLVEWIRQRLPALPVILTSGDARTIAVASRSVGHITMFSKPYDIARIVECMGRALGFRAPDASGAT